jgi:hypothetical protein
MSSFELWSPIIRRMQSENLMKITILRAKTPLLLCIFC